MRTAREVEADIARTRQTLSANPGQLAAWLTIRRWRPFVAVAVDWAWVAAAVALVMHAGAWAVPIALLILGNRQRALGNLLHEAAHHNLFRSPRANDLLTRWTIAPAVWADLDRYRAAHMRHHRFLGDPTSDPDVLPPLAGERRWWRAWCRSMLDPACWWSGVAGEFASSGPPRDRARALRHVLCWWLGLLAGVALAAGPRAALVLLGLWLLARATVFHGITVFRELCDHFALPVGGVLSATRDVAARGPLRWFIHPRNNGYHLTHHLLPAVPWYHLPRAHRWLKETRALGRPDRVRTGYLFGPGAVWRPVAPDATVGGAR